MIGYGMSQLSARAVVRKLTLLARSNDDIGERRAVQETINIIGHGLLTPPYRAIRPSAHVRSHDDVRQGVKRQARRVCHRHVRRWVAVPRIDDCAADATCREGVVKSLLVDDEATADIHDDR